MSERRKDDGKLDTIMIMLEKQAMLVDQLHFSWFGKNGNPGYKTKIDKMETSIGIWTKITSSAVIAGLTALIKSFWR